MKRRSPRAEDISFKIAMNKDRFGIGGVSKDDQSSGSNKGEE